MPYNMHVDLWEVGKSAGCAEFWDRLRISPDEEYG